MKRPEVLTGRLPARFWGGPEGVTKIVIGGKPVAGLLERIKQGLTADGLAMIDAMTVTIAYSDWRTPVAVQRPSKSHLIHPTRKSCSLT